ncbi:MAG: hypothetical protein FI680_03265 [SAR202 cluster bacterium]|nr:hypothetical protein [SAR202 cluster bacterium]
MAGISPQTLVDEFTKNGVTHVVCLPDSETNWLYLKLEEEPSLDLVPVCREGETMPIAAGLSIGGKRPIVLIQNTGMFESGDSIRGIAIDLGMPMVMVIGYRGWTRKGPTPDSAARYTEPILNAWGINYYLMERDEDASRISMAFEEAYRTNRPVAVLVGDEYHAFSTGRK